jgi:hypothetical protein
MTGNQTQTNTGVLLLYGNEKMSTKKWYQLRFLEDRRTDVRRTRDTNYAKGLGCLVVHQPGREGESRCMIWFPLS